VAVADRNLLFGILALQTDFITRDQLVRATQAWVLDKVKDLGEILLDQRALDARTCAMLEAMVARHIELHAGDPQQSLAALSSASSIRRELEHMADADVMATLTHVGKATPEPPDANTRQSPGGAGGTSTSSGPRFRILRPHARGGLGEVFLARDEELNREVALKEIQDRHARDAGNRSRFVLEAEITGGLEHPGIVPVYSLGAHRDGRPFYAMRFIRGDSLADAIKRYHQRPANAAAGSERNVEFRQLLGRFNDVCNAIAYAHSRGVLHRDLKPGNIMLGKYGETLVVDWGLAKAGVTGQDSRAQGESTGAAGIAEESPLLPASGSGGSETVAGSTIGTPPFMSPEQAAGRLDLLGPASDVYSLGATLYCVLTGYAPFEGKDVGAVLRKVRAGDFPRPRQQDPDVPAALEAVCLKAMALDPRDRYGSGRALADDIEHWLADEPVSAAPESATVRARRWMRKHPATVSGIAAAVLVAVAGLSIGAYLLGEKNQELTNLNQSLTVANTKLDSANGELTTSNQNLDAANQDLTVANANLVAARQKADQAAEAEKQAADKERRAAALALDRLGQIEKANGLLASIFTDVDPRYAEKGGPTLLEQLTKRLLATADKLDEQAIRDPLTVARLQNFLGATLVNLGQPKKASELHARARATQEKLLGPDHLETLTSMASQAADYLEAGNLDLALPLLQETLALEKDKLGPDDPATLTTMNCLAEGYRVSRKFDLALPLYEETLKRRKARLGPDHPDTLRTMNNLANAYRLVGKLQQALPLFEETLERRRATLGPEHPDTLNSMNAVAAAYHLTGKLDLAVPLYEKGLERLRATLGPSHPVTLNNLGNLAKAYLDSKKPRQALLLLAEFAAGQRQRLGARHPDLAGILAQVSMDLIRAGELVDAEKLLREVVAIRAEVQPDAWSTFVSKTQLGACLLGQKKYAEAEPLLKEGYDGMKQRDKARPPQDRVNLTRAVQALVQLYEATGRKDEARKWAALLAPPEGKLIETIHDAARPLTLKGELDAKVPGLVFLVRLKAGVRYQFDLVSPDPKMLDPYLVLQDAERKTLAEDDDSGGHLNARIVHRAPADGVYRLRASSFNGGRGPFTLSVRVLADSQQPPQHP
jgi:serine/threonine protein kinase